MSDESVLDYIESHVEELRDSFDTEDPEWYEGAIDALEHILAKFGRE